MIWVLRWGQGWIFLLSLLGFLYGAIFEPEAVIAGLEDVAMVGQAVEESGGHLGIAEDRGPFARKSRSFIKFSNLVAKRRNQNSGRRSG